MSGDQFKVGDVVEIKSGGPPMTVTSISTNLLGHSEITCVWFFNMMCVQTFSPSVLIPSRPRKFEELKGGYTSPPPDESVPDDA